MTASEPAPPTSRLTLRKLPLAARFVLTLFLLAVGVGYLTAMVQLHMKDSKKNGEPMPGPDDLIELYSGLKKYDPNAPPACSKLHDLISGDKEAADVSKTDMTAAFFKKSVGYQAEKSARGAQAQQVDTSREAERQAMLAFSKATEEVQSKAYAEDRFPISGETKTQLTEQFRTADKEGVKIKTLIDLRCQRCHKERAPSLGTWDEVKLISVPPSPEVIDGKYVRSTRQKNVESLTQSTHAHALSFAMLWMLTGLIFSFTSYPGILRCTLAPLVILAQFADLACWWLARVPGVGPYFALAILGTGAVVGIGVILQITLSILNMYSWFGRFVVLLLMGAMGAGVGYVGLKVIQPALDDERKAAQQKGEEPKPVPPKPVTPQDPPKAVSQLEKLLLGPKQENKDFPFDGKGTMVPAFFGRDGGSYKREKEKRGEEVDHERDSELAAMLEWIRAKDADRKATFESDKFPLSKELAGKPMTKDYKIDDRHVKIKSIITDRCARCHGDGGDQPDYPLETYEQLLKYLKAEETK